MSGASVTAALVVAAGRGLRAGGGLPKQYLPLAGRAVIAHTLAAFTAHPAIGHVLAVIHPDDVELFATHAPGVAWVAGGATRAESVRAGLEALAVHAPARVLIHDAARPLVPPALIGRVLAALDIHPAAAPAVPVSDALWHGAGGLVAGVQDRDGLWRAQTPQGFRFGAILAAHRARADSDAADDVAVARAAGLDVAIVAGDETNIKITTADDFDRAARLMEGRLDIRTGTGFDVHRFGPGDRVMLCGVAVPHDRGLQGHSDADVAMHAITDAIYGALAEGDIGQHFPPSNPQWKGADSAVFLRHAVDLARNRGFGIGNIDCTIVCERPKVGPHAQTMRERLAEIAGIEAGRIGVKATTSERLGFTGREEGIAAMAAVTLVAP